MAFRIFLFTLVIAACSACFKIKDSEPKPDPLPYPLSELPLPTQEGKGTFGCVINGEPWVARVKPSHPWIFPLRATYDEEHYGADYNRRLWLESTLNILSHDFNKDSLASGFTLDMRPMSREGYYNIFNLTENKISYIVIRPGPTKSYVLDTQAPFQIYITKLDTINKIVSGTFEFDMHRISDSLDVLHIRHGRFDAWYEPR